MEERQLNFKPEALKMGENGNSAALYISGGDSMIYLDHAATTPLLEEAKEAMLPFLQEEFGNASALYRPGTKARRAVNGSRRAIAQTLQCDHMEIYFTSGGTEADNWAIKGTAMALMEKGRHIITSVMEHPAVQKTCSQLERFGFCVTRLGINRDGVISLEELRQAIRPDTILITIMTANNETGVIQPIREIGEIARQHGILFHTDAVQAYGHIPLVPKNMNIDLMSVSGHKFGGPKGIGFLYVRQGVRIEPLLSGGGQESGMRSGTESPALSAGIGKAAQISQLQMEENAKRQRRNRDYLKARLVELIPKVQVYESGAECLPGFLSVSFPGKEAEQLIAALDREDIYVSGGSACASAAREPSRTLTAIGLAPDRIKGTLRITVGPENTEAEMEKTARVLAQII